jgi:dipeptidyl-peptidase 4
MFDLAPGRLAPAMAGALAGLLCFAGSDLTAQNAAALMTSAEQSGWQQLTPHEDVLAFYQDLVARSPDARWVPIGESREGRDIFKVVLARPATTDPLEAHRSGKPVIVIAAQVHGNEPAGKEGLMLFARDIAMGDLSPLLDEVTLVLVPQLNPDGAEAGTWGTRANAAGYNVNRDYIRLQNPETRAIVQNVLVPWQPHVVVDAHELLGPPRVYDFYLQHAEDLSGPSAPTRLSVEAVTPAIVQALEGEGFDHFPYHVHGTPEEIPVEGVTVGLYGGRNLRNYGGIHGAVSILFESLRENDARVGIEHRARAQRVAVEGLVRYVAENPKVVIAAVEEGRREMRDRGSRWDPADEIAIRVDVVPRDTVPYRMAEMEYDDARGEWVPTGRIREVDVPFADSAVVRLSRPRPVGYVIAKHRQDIARHLASHGVEVERLSAAVPINVEALVVDSIIRADEPWEGFTPRTVWSSTEAGRREVPEGAFLVRAGQRLSPILFQLLEPEDEDSYASMGWFSAEKRVGRELPVLRVTAWPAGMRSAAWPGTRSVDTNRN